YPVVELVSLDTCCRLSKYYQGGIQYEESDKRLCSLSKGKIHCSCWMCRFHGPTASDMRKMEMLKQMEQEYDWEQ
ncbi:MAG: hypothetical protein Q4G58_13730, partial [bacterium]|nr:hypothetical protein [bacterium]